MADKQKEDFLSLAYYWSFINRFSEIHVCNAFFSKNEKYVSPLILTLKQEGAMIDSCEPDQIADLLSRTLPEKYLALKICERHNFIVRHIADARMFGIGATHELLFFCSLALFFGDFFSKEEKWIAVLNQVKEKIMTLEEAASKVDADV